jgi:ribosome-associated protein
LFDPRGGSYLADMPENAAETSPSDEDLLAECRVDTFRSGGKGGQHQNVTESGVRLTHLPTGIVVTARDERSQHRNKSIALGRLRERLEERSHTPAPRVPTRPPARSRRARLEAKRKRSRKKKLRRPPRADED